MIFISPIPQATIYRKRSSQMISQKCIYRCMENLDTKKQNPFSFLKFKMNLYSNVYITYLIISNT